MTQAQANSRGIQLLLRRHIKNHRPGIAAAAGQLHRGEAFAEEAAAAERVLLGVRCETQAVGEDVLTLCGKVNTQAISEASEVL